MIKCTRSQDRTWLITQQPLGGKAQFEVSILERWKFNLACGASSNFYVKSNSKKSDDVIAGFKRTKLSAKVNHMEPRDLC
jgi:DNA-directed RNA polymerase beta subunit